MECDKIDDSKLRTIQDFIVYLGENGYHITTNCTCDRCTNAKSGGVPLVPHAFPIVESEKLKMVMGFFDVNLELFNKEARDHLELLRDGPRREG